MSTEDQVLGLPACPICGEAADDTPHARFPDLYVITCSECYDGGPDAGRQALAEGRTYAEARQAWWLMCEEWSEDEADEPEDDPCKSIVWPNGWLDAWGQHRRLNPNKGMHPFERLVQYSGWEPTFAMGPLPHRRAK